MQKQHSNQNSQGLPADDSGFPQKSQLMGQFESIGKQGQFKTVYFNPAQVEAMTRSIEEASPNTISLNSLRQSKDSSAHKQLNTERNMQYHRKINKIEDIQLKNVQQYVPSLPDFHEPPLIHNS